MRRTKHFVLLALALALTISCVEENEKYQRPDWLAGKLYTQIVDTPMFSTFAEALELTGYDTIINTSGSYTVFAPDNEAFSQYFTSSQYSSLSDIPKNELARIVKYHIVQNPWTIKQLQSLDVWGWIDPQDENNDEPRGYKRQTILEDEDRKYGVKITEKDGLFITDTTDSPWYRRVFTDSRKYAPIFFQEYFGLYNLTLDDYTFYFDRTFEPGEIYFASGKITGEEIFAENGFIYPIDRVIAPAKNAYQLLESDESYSRFFDLVNQYADFEYNQTETFNQPEALAGFNFDSLFELSFPNLAFDLTKEKTDAPPGTSGLPGEVTIRYHKGIVVPTNDALVKFDNDFLPGGDFWAGIDNSPPNIQQLFVNTHMSPFPIYKTTMDEGFVNGEEDRIEFDEGRIIDKVYGSNATFMSVSEALVPRAFSSITGPVYLRRGYSKVMWAIERSGLLPALKRERDPGQEYVFFVESDAETNADTSLMYNPAEFETRQFYAQDPSGQRAYMTKTDLRTLIMNHVATRTPTGIPRKEFIENLAGNYIIFNNETGVVSGTAPTTEGYLGAIPNPIIPERIDVDADNGKTYNISDWFSFTYRNVETAIAQDFPEFHALIIESGLAPGGNYDNFFSTSVQHTVFALDSAGVAEVRNDSLEQEELQELILNHFVRKKTIFTDGAVNGGYYETLRPDESSSEFAVVYSKIYIEPGIDQINFPGASGGTYATVTESENTNFLLGQLMSEGQVTISATRNNGVVHGISTPLYYDLLDTSK